MQLFVTTHIQNHFSLHYVLVSVVKFHQYISRLLQNAGEVILALGLMPFTQLCTLYLKHSYPSQWRTLKIHLT